jgi:hypothetical protein
VKGLAILGWISAVLASAGDEQQPLLIDQTCPVLAAPQPHAHGHYEPIDPDGDERAIA